MRLIRSPVTPRTMSTQVEMSSSLHEVLVWRRLPVQGIGPSGAPNRVLVSQRLLVLRISLAAGVSG